MQKQITFALILIFIGITESIAITRSSYKASNKLLKQTAETEVSGELKKWHKITLSFQGPYHKETDTSPNPFLDYRLEVTFTNGNKTYKIPGYFAADGNASETSANEGNIWRVHFAPDATGTWNYSVSFRSGSNVAINSSSTAGVPDASLDGKSGSINVQASDKAGRDFRGQGRLQYVGEHFLKFAESGEYFVKGGPDAPENFLAYEDFDNTPDNGGRRKSWSPHQNDWKNGDPSWQNGKGTEIIGAINYLANKGLNAFSFLTMNIKGDDKNVYPYVSDSDFKHFDCSKLDQWEIVFEHADKLGLYLHFKTQETENDQLLDGGDLGTYRKLYYRELIARYAHHLALNWNLGEENTNTTTQIKAFAQYFADNDPYQNHIVLHTYPGQQEKVYTPLLGNASQLSGISIQIGWNKVYSETKQWVNESANAGKKWVVANDEQGSAQVGVPPDNHSGTPDKDDIRKQTLWGNLMAGGAGVEYYFGYSLAHSDLSAEDFRSRDISWNYVRHALEFFKQHLPFQQMKSNENLVSEGWCLAKEGEVYVVYLPDGGSADLTLNNPGTYQIKWFDPRNGGGLQNGSLQTLTGTGSKNLGQAPKESSEDWAVLITKTAGSNQSPEIKVGTNVSTGSAPLTVNFDASGSNDPDGDIVSYEWDFGDGNTATGSKVQHTFTQPGTYTVTLKVTDNLGTVSTKTIEIKVNSSADCAADFVEKNGLVVAEIESVSLATGWQKKTDAAGYTGTSYYAWEGGNQLNSPGKGLLEYKIQINNPGIYRFQWRSKVGIGSNATEHNDSWLKIPDADDFYGQKGTDIVRPKGVCTNDCPNGSGSNGWFKIYSSGTTNWTWSTRTSDNDAHDIYARFDKAGIYTVQISGRSDGHFLDRFVLYSSSVSGNEATNTSNAETLCQDSPPPADYQVTFVIKDENGNLLAGANVNFNNKSKSSSSNGQVVFSGLTNGIYNYTITQAGYITQTNNQEVKDGNVVKNITLIKEAVSYTVTFKISDDQGPLNAAIVNFNGNSKQTNAQGEVSFVIDQQGNLNYTVEKNGYQTVNGSLNVTQNTTKNITLVASQVPDYEVTFNIKDESGNAIPDANVNFNNSQKTSNANGQVVFSGITNGQYSYSIAKNGYLEQNGNLEVKDDHVVKNVILVATSNPVFEVVFEISDGIQPLLDVHVTFNNTSKTTDSQGLASFLNVNSGSYEYEIAASGYISQSGTIEINQNKTLTIILEPEAQGFPVSFVILDEEDQPVPLATILFDGTEVITDSLGMATLVLDTLAKGLKYTVKKPGYIPLQGIIDVLEENMTITLVFISNEPIVVYPNPAMTFFKYKTKFEVERIEIKDIQDKFLQSSTQTMGNNIDISGLRDGMFMVFFYLSDGRIQVNKLIKK